jgi:hypothetical protein
VNGKEAPIVVKLELWPDELKAKGTLTDRGRTRDLEIASPVLLLILNWLGY